MFFFVSCLLAGTIACSSAIGSGFSETKSDNAIIMNSIDNHVFMAQHLPIIPSSFVNRYSFYYFKNLQNGLLLNYYGNCTYTAFGMLLSYFDSYLDDSIIPSSKDTLSSPLNSENDMNYRFQSPGIANSQHKGYKNETDMWLEAGRTDMERDPNDLQIGRFEVLCKNEMDKMYKDGWYLGYLYHIALESGAIAYKSPSRNDYLGYGTTNNSAPDIFQTIYAQTKLKNLSQCEYSVEGKTRNEDGTTSNRMDVRNFIINKLMNGVPVACGGSYLGSNNKSVGHSVTAYYYDDTNNCIYGNLGYQSNSTDVNLDAFFDQGISSAFAFVPNTPLIHSHSMNYLDGNGSAICSCQLSSHQHHDYSYSAVNVEHHRFHCSLCGDSLQTHDFSLETHHGVKQYAVCKYCGYSKLINSNIDNPFFN